MVLSFRSFSIEVFAAHLASAQFKLRSRILAVVYR